MHDDYDDDKKSKEPLSILGFNLSYFDGYIQFILLASFIIFCFMMSGVTQEYVFTQYKGFDFGFFATLIQFIVYASFGYFGYRKTKSFSANSDALLRVNSTLNFEDEIKFISPSTLLPISSNTNNNNFYNNISNGTTTHQYKSTFDSNYTSNNTFNNFNNYNNNNMSTNNINLSAQPTQLTLVKNYFTKIFNLLHFDKKLPIKYYFILGSCMVIGMGLGNQSLAYLNYPTKVLFKSSKLLITMFVGVLLLRKKYKVLDYLASIFLLLGLFSLVGANQHHSISGIKFEYFGVFLISLSLIFDSISSNLQEKVLREMDRNESELIFYSYFYGSFFILLICLGTNQLIPPLIICFEHFSLFFLLLLYSFISYVGSYYTSKMIKQYGILVALTTTSCRKILSIILSHFIFPKPFNLFHVVSILFVFTGVFIRVYCKQKKAIDKALLNIWFKLKQERHQQE